MKTLITAALLLFFYSASAQTWIQEGATWHYEWWSSNSPGFQKMTYTKDTVLAGKLANKLEIVSYNHEWGKYSTLAPRFIYRNGDTVFYWVNNGFSVLYNFGAKPGETWDLGVDTNYYGCGKSIAIVDSIGTININGKDYRWISVNKVGRSSVFLQGKIVERFGAMEDHFFPMQHDCDSQFIHFYIPHNFACFEDDSFPLYNPLPRSCEHWLKSGIDDAEYELAVKIYPNPATEKLHIKLTEPKGNYRVQIFDATGKKFTNRSIGSGEEVVDISALPKGIYFVRVTDEKGNFYSQKIMKM